jgi:hypothetical protein
MGTNEFQTAILLQSISRIGELDIIGRAQKPRLDCILRDLLHHILYGRAYQYESANKRETIDNVAGGSGCAKYWQMTRRVTWLASQS